MFIPSDVFSDILILSRMRIAFSLLSSHNLIFALPMMGMSSRFNEKSPSLPGCSVWTSSLAAGCGGCDSSCGTSPRACSWVNTLAMSSCSWRVVWCLGLVVQIRGVWVFCTPSICFWSLAVVGALASTGCSSHPFLPAEVSGVGESVIWLDLLASGARGC